MKKNLILVALLLVLAFQFGNVYAQSGNVNFLGSIAGTTQASNCGIPTTPSLCIVGDGVWVWQSSSSGWQLIGASNGAVALTINGVTKNLPASFTIAAAAPTVSAPSVSATAQAPTATAPAITAK